jgi:hypothetical protein
MGHKQPGPGLIVYGLGQKGGKALLPNVVLLFRASCTLGYLSKARRNEKVFCLPKALTKIPNSFSLIEL